MVTKDKKVNEVFRTTNYSRFKFRNDNRTIRPSHVNHLIESIKTNGWEKGSYIVINEKGDVIDGQHRLVAAKTLGIPVFYTIEKGANFDTIQTLNQNQCNWSKQDHIHGWVIKGNENYVTLEKFMEKYPMFRITECLMFLANSYTSIERGTFESGLFKVNNLKVAEDWADSILELKPYFEKYYNKSIFVRAIVKLLSKKPEFKFSEFLRKVQLRPSSIFACGTTEQYIEMIESTYNYKRKDKVNLRF